MVLHWLTLPAGTVVEDLENELPRIARGISIRSDVSGAIPIAFGKVAQLDQERVLLAVLTVLCS